MVNFLLIASIDVLVQILNILLQFREEIDQMLIEMFSNFMKNFKQMGVSLVDQVEDVVGDWTARNQGDAKAKGEKENYWIFHFWDEKIPNDIFGDCSTRILEVFI